MKRMVMFSFVVVFSFLIVSCGGEEPNLPDDESKIDEIVDSEQPDETVDEIVDSVQPDIEPVCEDGDRMCSSFDNARHILICVNGFWQSERDCFQQAVPTEFYCRQGWDENFYCHENEIPADPSFVKLESLEECRGSACKELCFLQWDEDVEKDVYLYKINGNDSLSSVYAIFVLETSHNICYVNSEDPYEALNLSWKRIAADSLPIKVENKLTHLDGTFDGFATLSDTGENWGEKKKIRYGIYSPCLQNDIDICEKFEAERVEIEGMEGEFMLRSLDYFTPVY